MLGLVFGAVVLMSIVTLSPDVERAYEEFVARDDMAFFAVSEDGRAWGRSYCSPGEVCTEARLREIAIGHCLVHGAGCVIYARKDWR